MRTLLLLALFAATCHAANWAVLVAGSNGVWNYRHQADICHAYHVLINRGFAPSNIILFTYDDVAKSYDNPFKGKLFNKPGDNSIDYNAGCVKDYTGELVTPQNFLDVITGNAAALQGKGTGRVLQSGPGDHVFINFADHGAPGLIAFPSSELYANQLISAFKTMNENQMYKKLVFYLEACESGSMFDGLLDPSWNILAVSAANPNESSYATYCPPDDVVNGVEIGSCLGDLFSVNWMEDSDKLVPGETLSQQIDLIKKTTDLSEVCVYGDTTFLNDPVDAFIGQSVSVSSSKPKNPMKGQNNSWSSRDVKLNHLFHTYLRHPSQTSADKLVEEIIEREMVRDTFNKFAAEISGFNKEKLLSAKHKPQDYDCLQAGISAYQTYCGPLSDFSLGFVQVIVNACETGVDAWRVDSTFAKICNRDGYFYSGSISYNHAKGPVEEYLA